MTSLPNPHFVFRDARPEDRDQVLEFTAHTWEYGDYIRYVFDDWLADPTGRFLVVEDTAAGRVAASDKLTFLASGEAWFEGLRVHPAYRGHGLATRMQRYMIEEARRMGASIIRFLTLANNLTVHRKAYRDGFSRKFTVRFWSWSVEGAPAIPPQQSALRLRQATPAEAPALYEWWRRSTGYHTSFLAHKSWTYVSSSPEQWSVAAQQGNLLVVGGDAINEASLPPPAALLWPGSDDGANPTWSLGAAIASPAEWQDLALALVIQAAEHGIARIEGLLPDLAEVHTGLLAAGFTPETDDERLCLFELSFGHLE